MLVPRCVYVKVRSLGRHLLVVVGGIGEDAARVAKRAIGDQGAQYTLRGGDMRAIDARVVVCVC